jgi:3',5'-cyclic AMP phosphodiesterase CpdA
MSPFRIAHLSDLHLLDLTGVPTSQLLLNKRFTGWVNLKLNRTSHHKPWVVEAMADDLAQRRVDHVVVTGDLTNLALDPEFERARSVLERMGYGPEQVSVVPGNHDVYTRGAERSQRFAKHFAKYLTSDLDVGAATHPSGPFPFVRLRGPVAIIGLSTAVARLPLVSSGQAGDAQLEALAQILARDEVRQRLAVVIAHHPITNPRGAVSSVMRGWSEVTAVRRILGRAPGTLSLHGHLHVRVHEEIEVEGAATIHRLGATSASLLHENPAMMSGYNLYEIDAGVGLTRASARVWSASTKTFAEAELPRLRA